MLLRISIIELKEYAKRESKAKEVVEKANIYNRIESSETPYRDPAA